MNLVWIRDITYIDNPATDLKELFIIYGHDLKGKALKDYIITNQSKYQKLNANVALALAVMRGTKVFKEAVEKYTKKDGVDMFERFICC